MRRLLQFCCDNNLTFTIKPDLEKSGQVYFRFDTRSGKCFKHAISDSEIPDTAYQCSQLESTLIELVNNAFIGLNLSSVQVVGGDNYENH